MNPAPLTHLRIFLVRHAHAAWALPGVRDFDRPLDERGREEAARLAATMSVNGFEPDLVYCSNARRCAETLEILQKARANGELRVEYSDALYASSHDAYLDLIGSAHDDTIQSIMIIGHNPMLEDTAQALLQDDPAAFETALGNGFPTAGLMILDCDTRGGSAIKGGARFVGLLSPVDA
ncbi:SixA phosphatase family protein [Hoeflea alexandrii]|uniref:SixA phosphatase family protein n=1 Tax=Hoeflea alexandrii TaxID=288436 RepID=UPI0022B021C0|nr:histidine phosphatase family protein [Hoeflea alexandrii]MCZ4288709.1 histidine phosphatase family protein [Hoeflea alexandrii]